MFYNIFGLITSALNLPLWVYGTKFFSMYIFMSLPAHDCPDKCFIGQIINKFRSKFVVYIETNPNKKKMFIKKNRCPEPQSDYRLKLFGIFLFTPI